MRERYEILKRWGLAFLKANAVRYAAWLMALVSGWVLWLVTVWVTPPDQPRPAPPDTPPLPEPIVPPWEPGWLREPTESEIRATAAALPTPLFCDTPAGTADLTDLFEQSTDAPVWRLADRGRRGLGLAPLASRNQGRVGSCVAFGWASAIEYAMAAQSALRKGQQQELPDLVHEVIYGGSRVEANGGWLPPQLRGQDGSVGAWAAKWVATGGVVNRGRHGSHDLTAYSEQRCRQWGEAGVPNDLEPTARRNLATGVAMVTTVEEAKKALAQGYALAVCSNQGFGSYGQGGAVRNSDGFLAARGTWNHCMAIIGYRSDKPGFLILNSWGPTWVGGPKGQYADIPDGSFWAAEQVVARMLSQRDTYAVSGVNGFPRRKLNADDWIARNDHTPDVFALLNPRRSR